MTSYTEGSIPYTGQREVDGIRFDVYVKIIGSQLPVLTLVNQSKPGEVKECQTIYPYPDYEHIFEFETETGLRKVGVIYGGFPGEEPDLKMRLIPRSVDRIR